VSTEGAQRKRSGYGSAAENGEGERRSRAESVRRGRAQEESGKAVLTKHNLGDHGRTVDLVRFFFAEGGLIETFQKQASRRREVSGTLDQQAELAGRFRPSDTQRIETHRPRHLATRAG